MSYHCTSFAYAKAACRVATKQADVTHEDAAKTCDVPAHSSPDRVPSTERLHRWHKHVTHMQPLHTNHILLCCSVAYLALLGELHLWWKPWSNLSCSSRKILQIWARVPPKGSLCL